MKASLLYIILAALPFTLADDDKTVTVTTAPSIPSNEPSWKDEDTFTSAILNSTNTYRSQHNASDLSWNDTLADFATSYVDDNDCEFEHSGGPYGENLAMGYLNVTASIEAWGDEREEYDYKDAEFEKDTGHFTQLVWKNTTDVGCGRRLCGESGWYLVCEYWPRGNVEGEFKESVGEEEGSGAGVVRACGWALAAALGFVYWDGCRWVFDGGLDIMT